MVDLRGKYDPSTDISTSAFFSSLANNKSLLNSSSDVEKSVVLTDEARSSWLVVFDYEPNREDELKLKVGERLQLISKDVQISGDEGWWTGEIGGSIGIFPACYVTEEISEHPFSNSDGYMLPPEVKFEDLVIQEVIGVGGFGKVCKALWNSEEIAVKILRDQTIESIQNEAKLFYQLNHPNIISLKAVCLDTPNMCMVMEYARGGPLNTVIAGQVIPASTVIHWAQQVATGMHYLHEEAHQPLVHRDLKSNNVLLLEKYDPSFPQSNTLKITDFGLAREADGTSRMSAAGTYAWMAPEVIKNSIFSKKSDVWSFGVLLWEMLTGEIPYKGVEAWAVAYGVGVNKLTLPIPSTCPSEISQILNKCWAAETGMRPSFSEVLTILEDLKHSSFFHTPDNSFQTMQLNWKQEIEAMFDELRTKDQELRCREDELNKAAEQQKAHEELLNWREMELAEREMILVERELTIAVQQQLTSPGSAKPQPNKRRGRFRRSKLKFLRSSSCTSGPGIKEISQPSGFRHNISVQHRSPSSSGRVCFSPQKNPNVPDVFPYTNPALFFSSAAFTPMVLRTFAYPADGIKGKTWGPSAMANDRHSRLPISFKESNSSGAGESVRTSLDGTNAKTSAQGIVKNDQTLARGHQLDKTKDSPNHPKGIRKVLEPIFCFVKSKIPGSSSSFDVHSKRENNQRYQISSTSLQASQAVQDNQIQKSHIKQNSSGSQGDCNLTSFLPHTYHGKQNFYRPSINLDVPLKFVELPNTPPVPGNSDIASQQASFDSYVLNKQINHPVVENDLLISVSPSAEKIKSSPFFRAPNDLNKNVVGFHTAKTVELNDNMSCFDHSNSFQSQPVLNRLGHMVSDPKIVNSSRAPANYHQQKTTSSDYFTSSIPRQSLSNNTNCSPDYNLSDKILSKSSKNNQLNQMFRNFSLDNENGHVQGTNFERASSSSNVVLSNASVDSSFERPSTLNIVARPRPHASCFSRKGGCVPSPPPSNRHKRTGSSGASAAASTSSSPFSLKTPATVDSLECSSSYETCSVSLLDTDVHGQTADPTCPLKVERVRKPPTMAELEKEFL